MALHEMPPSVGGRQSAGRIYKDAGQTMRNNYRPNFGRAEEARLLPVPTLPRYYAQVIY